MPLWLDYRLSTHPAPSRFFVEEFSRRRFAICGWLSLSSTFAYQAWRWSGPEKEFFFSQKITVFCCIILWENQGGDIDVFLSCKLMTVIESWHRASFLPKMRLCFRWMNWLAWHLLRFNRQNYADISMMHQSVFQARNQVLRWPF